MHDELLSRIRTALAAQPDGHFLITVDGPCGSGKSTLAAALATALVEVETLIASLDSPTQRDLLRYRYIDGLTWEAVCVAINYGWRQAHNLHGAALDKLLEKCEQEKPEA